jgi:hypothetical protein
MRSARMHLARSQSTGTAAPARDQKLRRPQISGSNVQNSKIIVLFDIRTLSHHFSGQVTSGQVRCSRRFNFQYLKSALKELGCFGHALNAFSHQGCHSRINAKAIRMRKVVKCERFARIGILELHFRLRTPKSAN